MTPDNLDKKFAELRQHIFGDLKLKDEEGYDAKNPQLLTEKLNEDNMNITVETIFRKA